jgi:hypothetical protein
MVELRIEGYVIVSANGMLANSNHVMPDSLKFSGDQAFFNAALDAADVIVHGRNSFEDQPNSPHRRRIVLTRSVAALAPDPDNQRAVLWNPAGTSFDQACDQAGVSTGTAAIIGGPGVFARFFGRYDTFWLSQAPHVHVPGGLPVFPGVPERSPEDLLKASGLHAAETRILDAANDVTVTAWRNAAREG